MRTIGNIGHWLQSSAEAPTRTLLELLGKQRLVVEHHRGIVCYGEEEIVIKASYGLVSVTGKAMRLCRMSQEQLCIRGEIQEIKLTGREELGSVGSNQRDRTG